MASKPKKQKGARFIPKRTAVAVDWADAWYCEHGVEDKPQALPLRVIGFVLTHDKDGIQLAHEVPLSDKSSPRGIKYVPSFNILKIHILSLPV